MGRYAQRTTTHTTRNLLYPLRTGYTFCRSYTRNTAHSTYAYIQRVRRAMRCVAPGYPRSQHHRHHCGVYCLPHMPASAVTIPPLSPTTPFSQPRILPSG